MFSSLAFDVVKPGIYAVELVGDRGTVHLQRDTCWNHTSGGLAFDVEAGAPQELEISGCRWIATLWVEGIDDADLTLNLRRLGDAP